MKETVLVFVYGSLLKGEVNHYMLSNYSCVAEDVWIYGRLYDASLEYPFLIIDDHKKVFGELYVVPVEELPVLDEFEDYEPDGKDNLYERKTVTVYKNSTSWQAFVYICIQEKMLVNEITEGSWRAYRNNPS
ncbi:gamma-glutamylcyclotransferase family protein [Niallia sp.]|uniref:gamma-glutamylcyclotransferase family protein n=1 Tax=Niallia sp. TaxID=2837523 RepID=UPI00289C58CA|nr:gamma-glutamylcyclotransferase family protein [Niallia sp.]